MKKFLSVLFTLVMVFTLVACGKDLGHDKVLKEELIIYSQGDDQDHVSKNLYFLLESKIIEGAKISWTSNNTDVISINGSKGTVTRQDDDVVVTLTAKVTIEDKVDQKTFKLTVLSKDTVVIVEYDVTLNFNGATLENSIIKVKKDNLITKPTDPVREGYTFLGWFKEAEGTNPWNYTVDKVTKNLTIYAKWVKSDEPVEVLQYKFDFTGTDFGNSYSTNTNVTKTLPNVLGGNISVLLSRAAVNTPTIATDALVLSASNKNGDNDFAFMEFTLPKAATKMTFESAYWSNFDAEQTTKFVLEVKNGDTWTQVYDIKATLASTLSLKKVTIEGLNGTNYRFYAEGVDPTGAGSNGARIVIDNIEIYGMEVPGSDTVKPVINGATDKTFEVGATEPNWLDGVTATDNVDGSVVVTVKSNNVNLNTKGTYTIVYEAKDKAGNVATVSITVTVNEKATGGETRSYEFNFSGTDFGNSYSSNKNATKTLPNLRGESLSVILTRAAYNNNHGTYVDDFLVMSASNTSTTEDFAFMEFTLDKQASKMIFDATYWSSFDAEQVTKFVLEVKNGEVWTQVYDIKADLAGSLIYKTITVTGLNGLTYRFYAEGVDPTGAGSNGARILIDNFAIYTGTSSGGSDTVKPVINGAIDRTFEVGATEPNWLDGVTATDNVDGSVVVTVKSNNVNLNTKGTYSVVYEAKDKAGNVATVTITVTVNDKATGGETKSFEFNFSGTDFGNSYSTNNNVTKSLPNVLGGSLNVTLKRTAANNTHAIATSDFLVMSASNTSTTEDNAFMEFTLDKQASKMTFDAAFWSSFDADQVTKFVLEVKNGETWTQVYDIKADLAGSLAYKTVTITGLNGLTYRLYAEGVDPTGAGSNGARILVDNLVIYTGTSSGGSDTVKPVINGAIDKTFEVGATEPNWLDGVTATDNVDGSVAVTVKSNNVNLNAEGTYSITYEAKDKAGNVATVTITVTVSNGSNPGGETKSYEFNFSGTSFGNSYSTNNNVTKSLPNVLGGSLSVTLKRTAANSTHAIATSDFLVMSASNTSTTEDFAFMEFTLDKQAAKMTFDAAFWSSFDADQVTKFVLEVKNGEAWTQVYDIKADLAGSLAYKTVTITGLNGLTYRLYAEGVDPTGAGSNGARILIDNLIIYTGNPMPVEQQNLNKDVAALNIVTTYMEAGQFTLPSLGSNGSTISWSFQDETNPNNTLINLTTNQVTLPNSGQVSVVLVANLVNGEFSTNKAFTILIGEGDPITLGNVRSLGNGSKTKTQGVVTSLYTTATEVHFFIQDDTFGIYAIAPISLKANIVVGNEITLIGEKNVVTDQVVFNNITKVVLLGTKEVNAIVLTNPMQLANYQGQFVNIEGLLTKDYSTSSTGYVLVNKLGTFDVVIPANLDSTLKTSLQTLLAGKSGFNVTFNAGVYRENGINKLLLVDSSKVLVESAINPILLEEIVVKNSTVNSIPSTVKENITLPLTSLTIEGISFVWTSSNTNAITTTGVVTLGDNEVNVKLSYELKLDGSTIETGEINVTVAAKSSYTGYYASISGLSGTALKSELTRIISSMKNFAYSDTSYILDDTDADPNKTGNVILVYNRASISGKWDGGTSWNKEHIWPQSKLGTASVSDLHNLRPANPSINSSRGNLAYVDGSGTYGKVGSGWFPGEQDKGDIARAIFYMNTRWGLSISGSVIGDLNTFIKWHNADPVDDFERTRNNVIYSNQNNRNPYVDHPELVDAVYGKVNVNFFDFTNNDFNFVSLTLETSKLYAVNFSEFENNNEMFA